MTPQEFFDDTVAKVRAQGVPSFVMDAGCVRCRYRGPNGLKCAAGHHISDVDYSAAMEGYSIGEILLPKGHVINAHPRLAKDLQNSHDNAAGRESEFLEYFEISVESVAFEHGLQYTPPAAA